MSELIAESRGAQLVKNGREVVCMCPFACVAAYEPCEFKNHPAFAVSHKPRRSWWRRLLHFDGEAGTQEGA